MSKSKTKMDKKSQEFELIRDMPISPGFRVIEAGAGSGKTYSLVFLVLRLIVERDLDIRRILMVTFTEAAALELRQRMRERLESVCSGVIKRYQDKAGEFADTKIRDKYEGEAGQLIHMIGDPAAEVPEARQRYADNLVKLRRALTRIGSMQVTTIHGFCQRAVADHAVNAGYEPMEGTPVDTKDVAAVIAGDYLRLHYARGQAPVATLQATTRAVQVIMGDPRCAVSENDFPGLAEFVQDRTRDNPVLTFDGIILRLKAKLMGEGKPAAKLSELIRGEYDACFIDESQDTDENQWDIFRHLFVGASSPKLLVLVGDPKQAIYGFRGADVRTYRKACELAGETGKYSLPKNYRSTAEMVEAFNAIFGRVRVAPFFGLGSQIEYQDAVPHKKPASGACMPPIKVVYSDEVDAIANQVCVELKSMAPSENIGLLVRSNADADELHRALVARKVSVSLESTQSVYTTRAAFLVQQLLFAVLRPEETSVRRSLLLARPALFGALPDDVLGTRDAAESQDCQEIHAALAAWLADCRHAWNKRGFPACWEKLTRSVPTVSKRKKSKAQGDAESSHGRAPVLISVQDSLAQARFKSRLLVDLTHVGELLALRQAEHKLDPEQLLNYLSLRVGGEEGSITDIDSDASSDEALRPESAQSRVIVQTIHKSKGLEYDVVMLMNKPARVSPPKPGTVLKGDDKLGPELYDVLKKEDHDVRFLKQERQESARLLYVAITRARKRLVVMSPPEMETKVPPRYYGFYQVLHSIGINPYTWLPYASSEPVVEDHVAEDLKVSKYVTTDAPISGELPSEYQPEVDDFTPITSVQFNSCRKTGIAKDDDKKAGDGRPTLYGPKGSTSFSGLTKNLHGGVEDNDSQNDEDEVKSDEDSAIISGFADKSPAKPKPDESARVPLMLPGTLKGKYFGTFMHELLEHLDYTLGQDGREPELSSYVEGRLERSGLVSKTKSPESFKAASDQLTASIIRWLKVPLSGDGKAHKPFSLGEVKANQMLFEVRYALKAALTDESKRDAIVALFARHFTHPSLQKVKLRADIFEGLLIGTLDLAFAHGEPVAGLDGVSDRFFVLDWKTNHLGDDASDYDEAGVRSGIAANLYHLQYVLYVAALDLHLRQVMGSLWSYNPSPGKASFGGVYYLFLRGFGADPEVRPSLGVHYDRPPYVLIQEIQTTLSA
jgi:exodeoxyribonuclease V beta subunit